MFARFPLTYTQPVLSNFTGSFQVYEMAQKTSLFGQPNAVETRT